MSINVNFKVPINYLFIIESLKEKEHKTGKILYELIKKNDRYRSINVRYIVINSKNELFECLKCIANIDGIRPILHIECHGWDNGLGLALNSNEVIKFEELFVSLLNINIASHNNLLLSVAACNGIYAINTYLGNTKYNNSKIFTIRSPFLFLIGPEHVISSDSLIDIFQIFYTMLLDHPINIIISMLNSNNFDIKIKSSVELFVGMYKKYFRDLCSGRNIEQRISNVCGMVIKNKYGVVHMDKYLLCKAQYLNQINDINFNGKIFEIHKKIFFMTDKFIENEYRYDFNLYDIFPSLTCS